MSMYDSTYWFIYECVDNSEFEHKLTVGNEYYGSPYTSDSGESIILIREDDMGNMSCWKKERFIEL